QFIKHAIRDKMLESFTRGKDISEVLRDNSMSTMLLVTYTQVEGRAYLVSLLQPCMDELQRLIKDCEIDPMRVDSAKLEQNRRNLYKACTMLLEAVIKAQAQMPTSLQAMCSLIRSEVIRLWHFSVSYNQHTADASRKRCKSQEIKAPVKHPQAHPLAPNGRSYSESDSSRQTQQSFSNLDLPSLDEGIVGADFANDLTQQLQRMLDESVSLRQSIWLSNSLNGTNRFSVESPVAVEFLSRHASHQSRSCGPSTPRSPGVATSTNQDSGPVDFNAIEKMIGTLLFIRFFIPALTSPESFGLPDEPSSRARRGFVLCAKVIAALCNGIEFGTKEGYMECMNAFLRESRPKVRAFLQYICTQARPMSTANRSQMRAGDRSPLDHMDVGDYLAQRLESAFSMDDFDARCSLNLGEHLGLGTPSKTNAHVSQLDALKAHKSHQRTDSDSEDDLLLFIYENIDTLFSDCSERARSNDDWPTIEANFAELRTILGNFSPELEYLYYSHTGQMGRTATLVGSPCSSAATVNSRLQRKGSDAGLLTPISTSPDSKTARSPFTNFMFSKALKAWGPKS
ncbi:hypothetical protein H4R35_006079, partial [Dimargaris xerosporica]